MKKLLLFLIVLTVLVLAETAYVTYFKPAPQPNTGAAGDSNATAVSEKVFR